MGELATTHPPSCTAAVIATAGECVTAVAVKSDVTDAARGKLATTFVRPLTH